MTHRFRNDGTALSGCVTQRRPLLIPERRATRPRPVSGLPDHPSPGLPTPTGAVAVRVRSLVTVAGQCRILTGFPFHSCDVWQAFLPWPSLKHLDAGNAREPFAWRNRPVAGVRKVPDLTAMYLDIPACDNLPEPCMATFRETGPGQVVQTVRLWRNAQWSWCAVVGWADGAAIPAIIQPIEESGDGPALLLHCGDQGLRLAVVGEASTRWDTADATQWGEPFLIVTPDAQWR